MKEGTRKGQENVKVYGTAKEQECQEIRRFQKGGVEYWVGRVKEEKTEEGINRCYEDILKNIVKIIKGVEGG